MVHSATFIELCLLFDNNILSKYIGLFLTCILVQYLMALRRKNIAILYFC